MEATEGGGASLVHDVAVVTCELLVVGENGSRSAPCAMYE